MEASDHNSRRLKRQEQHIKKVVGTPVKPQSSTQSCYRCGKPNHTPAESRYRDAMCNACGKKGHIAPACRSNPRKKYYSPGNPQKSKKKTYGTHHVQQESQAHADSEEEFRAYTLSEPVSQHIWSVRGRGPALNPKPKKLNPKPKNSKLYTLNPRKKEKTCITGPYLHNRNSFASIYDLGRTKDAI